MGYDFAPLSWNGTTIVAGSVRAAYWDADDPSPLTAAQPIDPVEASIAGLGQRDVRGQPKGTTWLLTVELSATNQSDLDALAALFNEAAGLVYFRVTDGAAKVWRVQARLMSAPKRTDVAIFKVPIRVPDPRWEEDTQQTNNQNNMSGGGPTFSITNAGSRKARPVFTITPNAVKTNRIDDWKYSLRGFICPQNAAPNALTNVPVYLFDQSFAQARIDTTTLVKDTTVSNQINQVGGITGSATTIPIDTAVGGGLPAAPNMAMVDTEQIYYTGNTGTQLTGVTRGYAGTAAVTHADNAVISKSEAMANGDDLTVWINGVRVDRYLVNWNTAATDVVVNVSVPPGTYRATNTIPFGPGDTTIPVGSRNAASTISIDNLPASGFALMRISTTGALEIIHYTGKSGESLTGVSRALWGTSAMTLALGQTAQITANPLLFVVAVGKALAAAPLSSDSTRPCIQLPGSSNQAWKWGDTADDSQSVFFDAAKPDRTAQWVPGYDDDGNPSIIPLVQLSTFPTNQQALTFNDANLAGSTSPYNVARIDMPQGTSTLTADWTPAAEILNLEAIVPDGTGRDVVKDQLQQSAAAAARVTAFGSALTYGVKLKARYNVITGWRGANTIAQPDNSTDSTIAVGAIGQTFVLEKDAWVSGYQFAADMGANTQILKSAIFQDSGGQPVRGSANIPTVTAIASTTLTGGMTTYTVALSPRLIPAGIYHLIFWRGAPINFIPSMAYDASRIYPHGNFEAIDSSPTLVVKATSALAFRILGTYDREGNAPINSDQPMTDSSGARSATSANFDKVSLDCTFFPWVHRLSGFTSGLYHCAGLITDNTTGDSIAIDQWMETGAPLVIDCDARSATYTEDGVAYAVPGAITPSNVSDWMALPPGSNSITYAEPNMVSTTLQTTWRGRKTG